MIYKHNFSPHNVPLWNNRIILSKRKSVFTDDWMKKQIWSLMHLMDDNGYILQLEEFNNKYNLDCSVKDYFRVTQNIPAVLIQFIKNNLDNTPTPKLKNIKIDFVEFLHKRFNNKFLRQYLVNTLYPGLTRGTLSLKTYKKQTNKKNEILAIRTKFLKISNSS